MLLQTSMMTGLFKADGDDPRVDEMLALLAGRGWLTRAQIADATRWSERTIRMIAEAAQGRVLSGQRGFKLTKEATPEEFRASNNFLRSQAHCMLRRADETSRVWHSAGHQ